jgi:hypothetical protein
MYLVTVHAFLKKNTKHLLIAIISVVAGGFGYNAYLRWQGVETSVALSQQEVILESGPLYFYVCSDAHERGKRILEQVHCGIDSCVHWYFDFDGTEIGVLDDYATGLPGEKKESDYARWCKRTTSEYFYRFVARPKT